MDKYRQNDDKEYDRPELIQSLDAYLYGKLGYIPPGQNICAFLHLDPESDEYKESWHEPGDVIYASSIDHPFYFHRKPDGRLTLSEKEFEPDSTMLVDDRLADVLSNRLYIPVFAVDTKNNYYVIGKTSREIIVYNQNQELITKFKLIGRLQCWYLDSEGVLCAVTSNGGSERARKNIIRVFRLNLPIK